MKYDVYQRSRFNYILEAALEYLISILVAGSFLATVTRQLGISDSLTGIISSFISLGCVFQFVSVFIRPKRVKPMVVTLSIANQLLFMLLYVVPLAGDAAANKSALFVALIFAAYFLYNIAHPKKINWFMSLVDDHRRGIFTANKEIVSLIAGMIFSMGMGALIDYYSENGNVRLAFMICTAVIFALMLLHTATMVLSVEKELPDTGARRGTANGLKNVFRNRSVLKVIILFVIWNIAHYCSFPFFGTYTIKELGFSLKFVSALSIAYSIARILVSRFWGRLADKRGFAFMIRCCLLIAALGSFSGIFMVPSNGKFVYTFYYLCFAVSQGGISSAVINLVFDYSDYESRADSLALCQAISGIAGFLSTLCMSLLVSHIQNNGNSFFGIGVYAQQVASLVSLLITFVTVWYVNRFFIKKAK